MTSTELVGPLPTVVFHGGYELRGNVAYKDAGVRLVVDEPPAANTLDPRYPTCAEHRTACVCREATLNEEIAELRGQLLQVRKVVAEVLAGHRTHQWSPTRELKCSCDFVTWTRDYDDEAGVCQCTGCQIARKAYLR